MSLRAIYNADGSVTVRCNGVEVTIEPGQPRAAAPAGGGWTDSGGGGISALVVRAGRASTPMIGEMVDFSRLEVTEYLGLSRLSVDPGMAVDIGELLNESGEDQVEIMPAPMPLLR